MKSTVTFLVDTREQMPLVFGQPVRTDFFAASDTPHATLREGDYSVSLDAGATVLQIRSDRKSISDLVRHFGNARERFPHPAKDRLPGDVDHALRDVVRVHAEPLAATGRDQDRSLDPGSVLAGARM